MYYSIQYVWLHWWFWTVVTAVVVSAIAGIVWCRAAKKRSSWYCEIWQLNIPGVAIGIVVGLIEIIQRGAFSGETTGEVVGHLVSLCVLSIGASYVGLIAGMGIGNVIYKPWK